MIRTYRELKSADNYWRGKRVEIAPHFDMWMRGARFGEVVRMNNRGLLLVRLDRRPSPLFRVSPEYVSEVF